MSQAGEIVNARPPCSCRRDFSNQPNFNRHRWHLISPIPPDNYDAKRRSNDAKCSIADLQCSISNAKCLNDDAKRDVSNAKCRVANGNVAFPMRNMSPAKAKTTGNTSKPSFSVEKVPFPTGNAPPTGLDLVWVNIPRLTALPAWLRRPVFRAFFFAHDVMKCGGGSFGFWRGFNRRQFLGIQTRRLGFAGWLGSGGL